MIAVGATAPDFTLADQDGVEHTLSRLRGQRVLLCFYPLDFSPVCTDQMSLMHDAREQLAARDVKAFGVSVDSAFSHKAFVDQLGIEIPLLADFHPKGEVARAYGVFIDERGHNQRALVIIGPDGLVEWAHQAPTPLEIPEPQMVIDALDAAR